MQGLIQPSRRYANDSGGVFVALRLKLRGCTIMSVYTPDVTGRLNFKVPLGLGLISQPCLEPIILLLKSSIF
jgi:hypothetical protein